MANYQLITPVQLGQAVLTTSYATLYTVPASTRTYLKELDICNTGANPVNVYISLVPSAGTAGSTNALFFNTTVNGYSTLQWNGVQILNAGATIQVKASAAGLTVTASGGEAT